MAGRFGSKIPSYNACLESRVQGFGFRGIGYKKIE